MPVVGSVVSAIAFLLISSVVAAPGAAPEAAAKSAAYVSCEDDPEGQLIVGDGRQMAIAPGQRGVLRLQCRRCCWIDDDVEGAVSWSLDPATAGSVDPKSGEVTVSPKAAVGSRVKVVGELKRDGRDGRDGKAVRRAESSIVVIDPRPQPWAGSWKETARLPCPGAAPASDAPLIEEFELRMDATFAVTWYPFERYQDYWGKYAVDRDTGAITFTVDGGNHVPAGLDLTGTFRTPGEKQLELDSVYLGAPSNSPTKKEVPAACGHRFFR